MLLPPRSRPLMAILGALSALPSLSVDIGLPAMPALAGAFAARPAEAQATLSAFLVGFAAGQLAHGPASDRLGRRAVLIAGLAAFVAAGVACVATRSLALLIAMRGLQGVGACAGAVVARAMVRDMFEREQGARQQSVLSLASNLGTMSGPILGGALVTAAGFRAVYAVLPAVGAALLVACVRWLPDTRPAGAGRRPPGAGYRRVLAEPRATAPAVLNGLVFGGMFACVAASPHLLLGRFGLTPGGLGVFFASLALASLAGSWLNHAMLARASMPALSALGLALNGLATSGLVAAAAVAPSLALVTASMAVQMFACGIVMPNAIAAAMAPLPRLAGTVAAVVGCTQSAFGAVAAALVALAPGSLAGLGAVVAGFSALGLGLAAFAMGGRAADAVRPQPAAGGRS
jgi:DHA1 family bicyclomycin/chloramphenicol resistance-like MFS transporter